jgi:hypothetical protein
VEHALPHPSGPSGHQNHPWRTIAVVAAGIATLELLGLLIVGIALLAKPVLHRAHSTAAAAPLPVVKKPVTTPTGPLLARRLVSVTILNGNGVSGAAAAEASRVRARGYKLGQVGNAPRGGYGHSVVMYRAGRRGEALRLARELQIRLVSPLDGLRPRDLHGAKLAVVVGG